MSINVWQGLELLARLKTMSMRHTMKDAMREGRLPYMGVTGREEDTYYLISMFRWKGHFICNRCGQAGSLILHLRFSVVRLGHI
jgi:hypothetical protein